ncbi:MAG: bifunctional glutamate N-acetyltransferase/amino-acid acetyltransferase ArgJ [Planctomycetes bacterium]|nr:bifunctional glutamate N-acetyltransferase/amino-acid acetyltransferase ArgJ [Planctomycetota bacterium]
MDDENHGVLFPEGFQAGYAACGIKSVDPDVALLVANEPCVAAGVFTRNAFAAAPVQWNRRILPTEKLKAVLINSGNANACTGVKGMHDVETCAQLVADLIGCDPEQVAVASTGIIGRPLPMEKLTGGIRAAHAALGGGKENAKGAARAIMTTDTRPKWTIARGQAGGSEFRVGGMAKGSGMICPNMATMLGFVTTDLVIPADGLSGCLRRVADRTFNRITVDGDSSTNDTVLLLASGASGVVAGETESGATESAFESVMGKLAREIVRDGEGATRLVEVEVVGAKDEQDAERAARAIANSPLVKCAMNGGDPNWGRIVCAAGYSGAEINPETTRLSLGDAVVFKAGLPTGVEAAEEVSGDEIAIRLELGMGTGGATVWTCDLSKDYVEINAEYHT